MPVEVMARHLLGWELRLSSVGGISLGGRIVETEAYGGADDPASHAANGQTVRNAVMFGPPNRLYVYRIYGVHWCANVVSAPRGQAAAVLIRALEPLESRDQTGRQPTSGHATGLAEMAKRRSSPQRKSPLRETDLCSGPGKLCQAMGINDHHNGADLLDHNGRGPHLLAGHLGTNESVIVGRRVGISKAQETPWRFGIENNPHLSKPAFRLGSAAQG